MKLHQFMCGLLLAKPIRLDPLKPGTIVPASITDLQGGETPVRHGDEIVDGAIDVAGSREAFTPWAAWDIVASRTSWLIP